MAQRGGSLYEQLLTSSDPANFGQGTRAPEGMKGPTYNQTWNASKLSAIDTLNQALANLSGFGKSIYNDISNQETQGQGKNKAFAVSRGLGNTTVLDSLARGTASDAQQNRIKAGDLITGRKNDLMQVLAQIFMQQRPNQGLGAQQQMAGQQQDSPWGGILGGLGGAFGNALIPGLGGLFGGMAGAALPSGQQAGPPKWW